ncbi:protein of unknown function [Jatrophihabitans endophyticus]|uniref:TLP18.3, Psb32 and MOLO-1 founding protein of phosphatase n=1 Tax=Jatrophihabitans endophyticus TaxID=1206085 RepID=A0A1M5PMA2_9ACTN|nr:DUF5130 family protein [Jatrophihabitans endophyticus]SHH02918.1 protein of unknown function [Jatrophihabitans endophyticus]
MSGEVAKVKAAELQHGPQGNLAGDGPFTTTQLTRLDEALTLASRETGLTFSVYVGEFHAPTRAHAEALFEKLSDSSVLVAVSPGQRTLHIVTGPGSAPRLPNRSCALAALAMRASFANGDLTGGIVTGLRMLADSAGS